MTAIHSLLVALAALAAARAVQPLLARRLAWALLLVPYLTPVLLVGYAYANFTLSLVHHPTTAVWFYAALLACKLTAVAAFVLHFAPRTISAEAVYLHWLTVAANPVRGPLPAASRLAATARHAWFLLHAGWFRGPVAALVIVFLLAFAECEMASLLGIRSWTVKLFDAHAGGLAWRDSLRLMLAPLALQGAALAAVVLLLRGATPCSGFVPASGAWRWAGWFWLAAGVVAVTLVPAGIVLRGTLRGAALLAENFAIGREIAASAAVAAVAAATAMFAARTRLAVLAVLGLLGSLVLALLVLALVPWPGVRETALPWAAALALVLLPYAVVFRRLLQNAGGTALHVARLARARELIWMLKARREFWMAFLLFGWAYWDLTAGAILAPVRWTPVTARLYNLMHYGQTAALSALVAAAFAAPLLALGAALLTRRWWARG